MYTIDDLADELNRKTWAVEKMLENRGYLKKNGNPRKSTINDGLMDEDGMITDGGWSTFIDELGYKNSGSDDDDDEEEDDDLDFMEEEDDDDDDGGEEPDEDEIKNIIRHELSNPDEEIVDALYDFFDRVYNEDDDEKDAEASLDCVRNYYSDVQDSLSEGHTLVYVVAMVSSILDGEQAYTKMDNDDTLEDLESVFVARGSSDATIEFMKSEFDCGFEADNPDDFISRIEIYDEAYSKGLDHYGDEEKARSFAEACYHGGEVTDLNDDVDDFEEYLRENEPWFSDGVDEPFLSKRTEYSADDILSYYYENSTQKPSYARGDPEFSMGCWTFTSKSYYDLEDEEEGDESYEDDVEEDDNDESWEPTEDYPTKESWEDDQDSLMFPNGHDDGE